MENIPANPSFSLVVLPLSDNLVRFHAQGTLMTLTDPPWYAVLQLAKLSGFSPIIATASPHNFDLVKSLGATHTIDRSLSTDEIAAAVKTITSEPVKVVYDAISLESTQLSAYSLLSSGGSLILVLSPLIPEDKLTADKKVVNTVGILQLENNKELGRSLFAVLPQYLETGEIKVRNLLDYDVLFIDQWHRSLMPWKSCQMDWRAS